VRSIAPTPLFLRAPGWYPDPLDAAIGAERWWTGTEWGSASRSPEDLDRAPATAPTPVQPVVAPKPGLLVRLKQPIGRRAGQ
jgi:hypothetical protein